MQTLPLSWSLETTQTEKNISTTFWNDKLTWLSVCSFQNYSQFNSFIEKYPKQKKNNLVIRGCNNSLVTLFKSNGYSSTRVGMEAVLETNKKHFEKKSIKQLVKRGLRHGKVIQFSYSIINKQKLEKFRVKTTHADEPQLENLFQTEFKSDNLLYVFISKNNKWLGAVLVSKNGQSKLHTELILRTKESPIGILESILNKIFIDAKKNNIRELSLGEVPFVYNNVNNNGIIGYFAIKFGRILKFAYSYDGLYNFKNKFQPRWDDIHICSNPQVSIEHLFFLFIKSNFHKLIFYKIKSKFNVQRILNKKQKKSEIVAPLLDFN